jgi:tetratricopeptide (TPR) repeat protein
MRWAALGAVCLLLIAVTLGWQWLHRARPDEFPGRPGSPDHPATAAAEPGDNPTMLYLAYMERGERAAGRGDFKRAARYYQRALGYASSKGDAQRALLVSLIGVSVRESPDAANQLAAELLREHPDDPALLMTFSDTALFLDNIYGEEGMEGALKRLERALRGQSQDPSLGKYILTSAWLDAGRPDLARREIEQALAATPDNQGLRLMACQLAWSLGDWKACLTHAERLQRLAPDVPDAYWYQATALERLGKAERAKAIYQELVAKHPDLPLGYLGMSRVLENSRDYAGALRWIRSWLDRSPPRSDTVQIMVRLLVLKGEGPEAVRWAQRTLRSLPNPRQDSPDKPLVSPAPAGKTAPAEPAEMGAPVVANRPLSVILGVAAGLYDAGDYDQAKDWALRGEIVAKDLPEPDRRGGLSTARTILGQIYGARTHQAKEESGRRDYADKAIGVYRALLEISPRDLVAMNNLASLLHERGDIDEALLVADQLCRANFSNKPITGDRLPLEILDTVGTIYRSAGRFDVVVELFQQAARRYGKEPQVLLHLGRAYAGMRQYVLATAQLSLAATAAEERAQAAPDAAAKARWQALAAEAREALKELPGQT